ncbi:MAG: hypothetical protein JSS00_12430 [Proteobacteria bacterium]|nr:hypothetical protein [Pseudomonadota bacterium]
MFDIPSMQRLDDETFAAFVGGAGRGLVLFGSHNGKPTLAQAHVLADAWADRHSDTRFGYIDALCCELGRKRYAVRLLPTLLIGAMAGCWRSLKASTIERGWMRH